MDNYRDIVSFTLTELTEYLKGKTFAIINISKSGTTTETALTFRLIKTQLEAQVGKEKAKELSGALFSCLFNGKIIKNIL